MIVTAAATRQWPHLTHAEPARLHLRRLRKAGMTLAEVSRACGVHTTTLYRVADPDIECTTLDVANAVLGVPMPPQSSSRPDWADDAACRGEDPRRWVQDFGAFSKSLDRRRPHLLERMRVSYAEQLATCADCPVRDECLADALDHERRRAASVYQRDGGGYPDLGIRGGTLPVERVRIVEQERRR